MAIDAISVNSGWAVQRLDGYGAAETAVFETVRDVGWPGGAELTFQLKTHLVNGGGQHNLGRFRLSVTADDRAEFADGLAENGDVTANWEILDPIVYSSAAGAVLSKLPDGSILASGTNADTETYTIAARTMLPQLTGIRLETMYDDSLPNRGPGHADNGNFVLVDFKVSAEPVRRDLAAAISLSHVDICWPGYTTNTYQVQYASQLTANQWVNFGTPVQGNGTNCVTDSIRGIEGRFYRIIQAP